MSTIVVRPLCFELALKAEIELSETPKKLEDGINHLKEWISKQPHLRARTDDQWLATFLRGCKYSLESAKKKIDLFYAMRNIVPEMTTLKYWHPNFKEIMRSGYSLILPKRLHPTDPRVILVRCFRFDPNRFNIMDVLAVMRVFQMICHMEDDPYVIAGIVLILDISDITMSHFGQMTPTVMRKIATNFQDASPIRFKAAHFIGLPSYCTPMFKFSLQLLNESNKRKVFIQKREDLHNIVSKDILPVEYGGNGGTAQEIIDYWIAKVKDFEVFLNEDAQYGTDEDKRPGIPKTAETLFGVDGSFRQLDFD